MQVSGTSSSGLATSNSKQIKAAMEPEKETEKAGEGGGSVAGKMQKLEVVNADQNMLVLSNLHNVPTDMSGVQKPGKVNMHV